MQSPRDRRQFLKASLHAPLVWVGASALPGCLLGMKPGVSRERLSRPAPQAEQLLASMTLDEKLGQMTQADVKGLRMKEREVDDLALGSVLNGGDSLPVPNTPEDFRTFGIRTVSRWTLVWEAGAHQVAGVEIKAGATVTSADFRGLRKLAEALGERWISGVVLYDGETTLPFGDKLYAVPIQTLWQP